MNTNFFTRCFSNLKSLNYSSHKPIKMKIKGHSSKQWLLRQMTDPYVEKAKFMNYRCRSAFKLIEIDDKHKILSPGNVVIDCGAAPGSWTQVAVKRTNSDSKNQNSIKGIVISIDMLPLQQIQGATILGGMDFTKSTTQEKIKNLLEERKINCILSDMAPNATGIKSLDQENISSLCCKVLQFSVMMSAEGAHLLIKLWDSAKVNELENEMLKYYDVVRKIKPKSSRQDSAELFLLGKHFKKQTT